MLHMQPAIYNRIHGKSQLIFENTDLQSQLQQKINPNLQRQQTFPLKIVQTKTHQKWRNTKRKEKINRGRNLRVLRHHDMSAVRRDMHFYDATVGLESGEKISKP